MDVQDPTQPNGPQVRLWNQDDFKARHNDAKDHTFAHVRTDSVAQQLREMQPWQRGHEARYEQMERALDCGVTKW